MLADGDLLGALRIEAERVVALGRPSIETPVPTCPGWGLGRLVGHLSFVHRWATACLEVEPPAPVDVAGLERPPRDDTVYEWYADGVGPMVDQLSHGSLDRPAFSWAGERDRRWWLRRLVHETVVHRVDAELAVGRGLSTIDPTVAVDGIDELFDVFVPLRFDPAELGRAGGTVHLHATDAEGEWLVRLGPDGVSVSREHAKGDVAVRGAAADLYLALWNRGSLGACEVFGDEALMSRFLRAATF